MYYVQDNGKIILYSENRNLISNTLKMMPQYAEFEILQTDREIVDFKNAFYFKDEITQELLELQTENRIKEIESELDELDKKRIRAVCEPSLKDENTTWLEFYNEKIAQLRDELSSLK